MAIVQSQGKSSAIAEVKGISSKTITIDSSNVGNARAAPSTKAKH